MSHIHHFLKISTFTCVAILFVLGSFSLKAQDDAVVLVIPDREAKIIMDGLEKGTTKANSALRIVTTAGEHYVEAQSIGDGSVQNKGELVQLEAGKQKILKLTLSQSEAPIATVNIIQVADLNFNLPGSLDAMAWNSNDQNKGKPFPVPEYYYAFDKGDEIILNLTMSNLKGTNVISISTYPDGIERYTNRAFIELKDLVIKVPERAIYRFAFASNHILARNAFFKISRKPGSDESLNFNTKVSFKRQLTPVSVLETQNFFINSGAKATFAGGKSRVIIPIKLPANTVEWFYRFSASRDQADIDNVKKNFNLLSEITKLVGFSGPAASVASLAIEHLSQPPGANYCDIYLMEQQHIQSFQAKGDKWQYYTEGSRENFMSGNVKVTCCNVVVPFLGLKNPDPTYGLNVSIEVVALVAKDGYVTEGN